MYCSNCGYEVTDDSKFCPNCGALLDHTDTKEQKIVFQEEDPYEPVDIEPKKHSKLKYALILVLAAGGAAAASFFLVPRIMDAVNSRNDTAAVVSSENSIDSEKAAVQESAEPTPASTSTAVPKTISGTNGSGIKETEKTEEKNSDYILPNSNSAYITDADLDKLSKEDVNIAKNEIYARHGRKFKDTSLQNYFNSKSWYKGTIDPDAFSTSVFNDYEVKNVDKIVAYQKKHGYI